MKGILSSGIIIGFFMLAEPSTQTIFVDYDVFEKILSAWWLGSMISAPFWFLFEAIVEKIKE